MRDQFVGHVDRFLIGEVDGDTLVDWVAAHFQDIVREGDAQAVELAGIVEASFVQLSEGVISFDELYRDLDAAVLRMSSESAVLAGAEPTAVTETGADDSSLPTLDTMVGGDRDLRLDYEPAPA